MLGVVLGVFPLAIFALTLALTLTTNAEKRKRQKAAKAAAKATKASSEPFTLRDPTPEASQLQVLQQLLLLTERLNDVPSEAPQSGEKAQVDKAKDT